MKKYLIAFCMSLLCIVSVHAQQNVRVEGVVHDAESGEVVIGASVYIRNSAGVGTVTDGQGRFSIAANINDVVVVEMLGYSEFEHLVTKAESNLQVNLATDAQIVEDVVVMALGEQRRISSVAAVTTVQTKDLQVPAASIANMLGGKVPGIITMQASGEPGKNISEFWIRGIGTFGANDSALVLIDGLEGDLNAIDPADIESFSILKDASATAVYGVRGANGVVLVTTKRGQAGRLRVTARANVTYSSLHGKFPDYVGGHDYALLANEARVVRGLPRIYSDMELELIKYHLDPDLYPNIDWQKEIMKNQSWGQEYYLSARGGGDIARYFFSLGASLESAAYKQDKNSQYYNPVGYNTYQYRVNLDINVTKTTQVYIGSDGFMSVNKMPGMANTDNLWAAQASLTPITIPKRYSSGEFPAYGADTQYSPYVMLNQTGMATSQNYSGKVTLAVTQDLSMITEGLNLKIQGAYDNQSRFSEQRQVLPDMYYAVGRSHTGELMLTKRIDAVAANYGKTRDDQFRKYHFEGTLNYQRAIGKHRVGALVYYYMTDQKDSRDASSSMNAIPRRHQGISSRLTYGYNDTYMIDFNFGYTGSENFEPGRQFGFFPSVAVGWVPTQYTWVQDNMPWLNFFKIRASYGTVGNDRIANARYPYLTQINSNAGLGWGATGFPGIQENLIGADNLAWERALKGDVGFEGRLFKERLDFTIDLFMDNRDGIFQERQEVPDFVGLVNMPYGNVGAMRSWGSDGNIAYTQPFGNDMSLTLRANYTYSKNEVLNWEQPTAKYDYQLYNGYPLNAHRGYKAIGLFRDEEDIHSSPSQSALGTGIMPGDIKYKDVNGDGKIDSDDQIALSNNTYPEFMYGFGFEFRYKQVTLGVLFKGTGKTDYYHVGQDGNGNGYVPFWGGAVGNVLTLAADQKNRWTPESYSGSKSTESQDVIFPRLSYDRSANNSVLSTWWHDDMGYLRLQEVTVNYNWNAPFMRKVGLSSIDLQLVGSNLAVWSKTKLWDPETAYRNGSVYPIPTQISFQMYLNF